MGLKSALLLASLAGTLQAAPVLRLVSATVGPVQVASGASGVTQTVEAYNIGDGSLSLALASSVSWIGTSVGSSRSCTTATVAGQTCIPLQFALNTSGLAAGTHTGIVTVRDPNAVDAPQTITVTVRVGPIDLYVAPGGSREAIFTTNTQVTPQATTQSGGSWLAVALDGTGSFRFAYPYRVRLQPASSLASGTYNGSIAAQDLTIPVTMRVTTQPIAVATPESLSIRLAQGAPAVTLGIGVSNAGEGSLSGLTATATGGSWLAATAASGGATVTLTPGTLAPGINTGSVAIGSNAANGTVTVPVSFEVVAKGAPVIRYQGVVDNGTFGAGDAVTGGDVVVVLGEQLSFDPLTVGKAPPLATQVGGAEVLVNGQPAPMYYSSYGQLAFQMPMDTPLGTAQVRVRRDGLTSNAVTVEVAARAPRLLLIGATGYGAIHNAKDISIPMPEGAIPGVLTHPANPGDTLILYAIGLGATNPAVPTGAAALAEPLSKLIATPTVNFGAGFLGITVDPFFAGLSPGFAGLYQVNVTIPLDAPKGTVPVTLAFPDSVSNTVLIVIQ